MAKGKYQRWLEPEGLTLLEDWARRGLTDEQIAQNMGCAAGTLYDWKNRYPEISEALKKGKEVIDAQVENALLKRALGYEYVETQKTATADGKNKIVQTTKVIPPDTTAGIFWLKNRRPDRWRDKPLDLAMPGGEGREDDLSRSLKQLAEELSDNEHWEHREH